MVRSGFAEDVEGVQMGADERACGTAEGVPDVLSRTCIWNVEAAETQESPGRFLGRDPLGEAGGNNLYGFVRNNPVNRSDYLGMFDWYYEGPNGETYHTMPHITDSPGDFLSMDLSLIHI